jgi:hypothetical protein
MGKTVTLTRQNSPFCKKATRCFPSLLLLPQVSHSSPAPSSPLPIAGLRPIGTAIGSRGRTAEQESVRRPAGEEEGVVTGGGDGAAVLDEPGADGDNLLLQALRHSPRLRPPDRLQGLTLLSSPFFNFLLVNFFLVI